MQDTPEEPLVALYVFVTKLSEACFCRATLELATLDLEMLLDCHLGQIIELLCIHRQRHVVKQQWTAAIGDDAFLKLA